MPKKYYSDYVRHCLRFYFRYSEKDAKNSTTLLDYKACEKSLQLFTKQDIAMLVQLFLPFEGSLNDKIAQIAQENNIKEELIWIRLQALEKEVAKNRGLL